MSHSDDSAPPDEAPVEDAAEDAAEDAGEDAQEQSRDADPGDDDVVEAPEGTFPADAKGFDGTPIAQILEEREERLSEENRPDNTEVSNAGRDFDGEKGMFTDEPGFDEAEKKYTLDET